MSSLVFLSLALFLSLVSNYWEPGTARVTLEMVTTAVLCYRGAEAYSAMPKGIFARGNLPLFDRHTQCLVAHIGMTDVYAYKL